jgi:hypothetical protein
MAKSNETTPADFYPFGVTRIKLKLDLNENKNYFFL